MLNSCVLIGRLTSDPGLQEVGDNQTPLCKFVLAVDRIGKDDEADFLKIIVWRKQAENCAKYLQKGSLVAVSGRIQIRNYEDQEGNKRYMTEIIANNVRFLSQPRNQKQNSSADNSTAEDMLDSAEEINPDDVPF